MLELFSRNPFLNRVEYSPNKLKNKQSGKNIGPLENAGPQTFKPEGNQFVPTPFRLTFLRVKQN